MHQLSIFIFRRSLRLSDNTGLIQALKESKKVIPIFIFTPEQLVKNRFKSNNCVQFMMESLEELDGKLRDKGSRLFYFFGKQDEIIGKLIKKYNIDAVYTNRDYTRYSVKRDNKIEKVCENNDTKFYSIEDLLLQPFGSILTGGNTIYTKFTPFHKKAKKVPVKKPVTNKYKNYYPKKNKLINEYKKNIHKFYKKNDNLHVNGGRKNALKILNKISQFKGYNKNRDELTYNTTHLSAYIKFGCVSIREVYHTFKKKLQSTNKLLTQLYWRDFYYNISQEYPNIYSGAMKEKYNKIKWTNNSTWFRKWKEGKTGFPIVDAGMRQMNTTGFMHNRARLIVSNFLIKVLLTNWQKGEWYFATQLVDYDPAVNNGNWQWSSSSGADSQPYFRVFNPWLQGKKFDKDAEYIKKWVPELEDVPNRDIHKWNEVYDKYVGTGYPKPIVDYKKQKEKGVKMYARIF